jgi:hypothetical protein
MSAPDPLTDPDVQDYVSRFNDPSIPTIDELPTVATELYDQDAKLVKARVVMTFRALDGEVCVFSRDADDGDDESVGKTQILIPEQMWDDLGNPPVITVSVEPGNTMHLPAMEG